MRDRPHTLRAVGTSVPSAGHEPSSTDGATQGQTGGEPQHEGRHGARALLDAEGVAELLGIGRSTVYELNASEQLPEPIKLGRRCRWSRVEIEAWILYGAPRRSAWERTWPRARKEILHR